MESVFNDPITQTDIRTMRERFGVDWRPYGKKMD